MLSMFSLNDCCQQNSVRSWSLRRVGLNQHEMCEQNLDLVYSKSCSLDHYLEIILERCKVAVRDVILCDQTYQSGAYYENKGFDFHPPSLLVCIGWWSSHVGNIDRWPHGSLARLRCDRPPAHALFGAAVVS